MRVGVRSGRPVPQDTPKRRGGSLSRMPQPADLHPVPVAVCDLEVCRCYWDGFPRSAQEGEAQDTVRRVSSPAEGDVRHLRSRAG